ILRKRGGAVAARRAHNPKVGGSNPSPATSVLRINDQTVLRRLQSNSKFAPMNRRWLAIVGLGIAVAASGCGGGEVGAQATPGMSADAPKPTEMATPSPTQGSGGSASMPVLTVPFVEPEQAVKFYVFGVKLPSGRQNPTFEIETADQSSAVFASFNRANRPGRSDDHDHCW
ncbi:MAG: hypothetical protein RI921_1091, partial [Chloroflexota bacterium]